MSSALKHVTFIGSVEMLIDPSVMSEVKGRVKVTIPLKF